MQYGRDIYLPWFQVKCKGYAVLQVTVPSRTGRSTWPPNPHWRARKSWLHLCPSLNGSLRGSGAGLGSSKGCSSFTQHTFSKSALRVGSGPPSIDSPWKLAELCGEAHVGCHQCITILLMWRQERELSWHSCYVLQLRNLETTLSLRD